MGVAPVAVVQSPLLDAVFTTGLPLSGCPLSQTGA